MSALRRLLRTDGRGAATTFVWMLEALVAWSLAAALGGALAGPLLTHPAGVHALYAEDGRLLLDFLRTQSATLDLAGSAALAAVALWGLAGVLLGGFVPAVAAPRLAVPTVAEALSDSLRRAPTLLALSLLSALGYGLAGLLGWFAWRYVDRAAALVVDARAMDLRHAAVVLVVLLVAAVVHTWHGVARFQAMSGRQRALAAAGEAAGRLAREPLRTLGRAAAWWLLAGCGTALAVALGAALDRHRAAWAVAALTLAQQLTLWWRVHCRMRWFGGLGQDDAG